MHIVIICCPIYEVINFEIKLSFLVNSFFYMTSQDRNENTIRMKKVFNIKWKALFIIPKGLSLKRIKTNFFGKWQSVFKAWTLTHLKHEKNLIFNLQKIFFIWIDALKVMIEIFVFNVQLTVNCFYTFLTIWEETFLGKNFNLSLNELNIRY